jgi:hypothetical protein
MRVWLLTLPILLLGETAGHVVVSRVLAPSETRHGLLDAAALVTGLAALSLAGLVWRAATSGSAQAKPLPPWRLAVVPALAFLAQEHVERFLADGHEAWLTAAEPVVLAGFAVQLALGAAALGLARSLLRAADFLGCALTRRAAAAARPLAAGVSPFEAAPVRLAVLASRHAGRAPPVAA